MLSLSKVSKTSCLPTYHSCRFATVVVGGSAKNHGSGSLPGQRRGPKVTANQLVDPGKILVRQRWWLPKDQLWYGAFNVVRGDKGTINAMCRGRVLYYYDTAAKRKYVSVVPEGEDPRDYMRPYYTPQMIYKMARERAVRRVKLDSSVNVHKKNKEMNELRNTQLNYIKHVEHVPMELIMEHEMDQRFNDSSFNRLCDQTTKLSKTKPVFEEEQIQHCLNNKLQFKEKQFMYTRRCFKDDKK